MTGAELTTAAASDAAYELPAALAAELEGPGWMYEWTLAAGIRTPLLSDHLREVHRTRREMIEPVVREALEQAGPGATALDLACCEGWFSHWLLALGADRVVGIDIREHNIRRATLVRDHLGVSAQRLELIQADVLELDTEALGQFDVVLMLGLIYHLEQPLEAIRIARRMTRSLCVIESQLTRQRSPIIHGTGTSWCYQATPASFAAFLEGLPDNALASAEGVMSLVPNRAALELLPQWAGFDSCASLDPLPLHDPQYVRGDRGIVAARVNPGAQPPGASAAPTAELPLPPIELRTRVGTPADQPDAAADYLKTGAELKRLVLGRLGPAWSWNGRRMLDFGCGAGRLLRHFTAEAALAEISGCDIDQPSIDWLHANLCPPFDAFTVEDTPGLPHPDRHFDVVVAASVFTHLTDQWAGWMLELHRVLVEGGVLIASYLGPAMAEQYLPLPWQEDRAGMLVVNRAAPWDLGGPTVFHSEWWIREHWGRAFEVGLIEGSDTHHGWVTLRKREVALTAAELTATDPADPREMEALVYNIEQLHEIDRWRWPQPTSG